LFFKKKDVSLSQNLQKLLTLETKLDMSKIMKSLFILVLMAIVPNIAVAQTDADIELEETLSHMWANFNSNRINKVSQQNNYQQQQNYGGYKVDDNNYVNQVAPTQDYLKTSSVNGQSAEGMIDNSGYSSSPTTTSRSTNNSRIKRDVNAESRAKSSAHNNPTGASLSRARTYERNNNIKYGRGR